MSLPAIVKSLDDVKDFQAHYVQSGEHYILDVADFEKHPRAGNLKRALDETRAERDKAIGSLTEFRDAGVSLEKWDELQKVAEKAKTLEELDKAGGIDGLIGMRTKQMAEDHARALKAERTKSEKLEAGLKESEHKRRRGTLTREITDACIAAECDRREIPTIVRYFLNPDSEEPLWDVDDNEKPVAYRPDKTVWYGKDGTTSLALSDYLEDQKQKHPNWWPPSNGSGAHVLGNGRLGANVDVSKMSAAEKMEVGRKMEQQRVRA